MPDHAPAPTLDALLTDPDWYLDRIDPVAGRATFVRSSRERLSATVFLDGRTPFASGDPQSVALDRLIVAANPQTLRLVVHMSFCGSTQLAHLIEASGGAIVLKEPQALVDLADWDRSLVEQGLVDDRLAPVLDAATALLSRGWENAGPTVLKPSNWANNLLPRLVRDGRGPRIVMIMIERRAFLRAAFRGGRDRLGFTARAAAHFAAAAGQSSRLADAIAGADDPLDRAARIVLLAHDLQQRLFDGTAGARTVRIDHQTILADPRRALCQSLAALGLDAPGDRIDAAVDDRASRDAKDPSRRFSIAAQRDEDRLVEQHHAARFDRALAWADSR